MIIHSLAAPRWTEAADIAAQADEHNAAMADEARTARDLGRDEAF